MEFIFSFAHLGRINGRNFARKIVDQTNNLNPDVIFITGDLFDGMGAKMEDFFDILDQLQSKYGIYFVTGNHEGYLDGGNIIEKLKQTKIQALDNELVEIDGLQIIGISYFGFDNSSGQKNLIESLPGFDKMNTEMVTKSYLDDKLAGLDGSVIARQKKEDKKLNLLIELLQKKRILEENEIKMLKEFKIFPELIA